MLRKVGFASNARAEFTSERTIFELISFTLNALKSFKRCDRNGLKYLTYRFSLFLIKYLCLKNELLSGLKGEDHVAGKSIWVTMKLGLF